jgi:hypothetical protein
MHCVMTFIALLAGAIGLALPLLYGLDDAVWLERRKIYLLRRCVDRGGLMSCLAVPGGTRV